MSAAPSSRWLNPVIALVLAGSYVAWLLSTASDLGYTRDEGFYFSSAEAYRAWFDLLWSDPSAALDPTVRDLYWRRNAEHPAFIKTLFVFSHWLFFEKLAWFETSGTSYRFVGMLTAGATLGLLYLWGTRVKNRWVGAFAALAFALLPRVFFHSHLACFDIPVAFLWFAVCYAYWRSLSSRGLAWAIATGVLFGLLLNTKHNSWLLPPVVLAHYALVALRVRKTAARPRQFRFPSVLLSMALVGPLVFFATWPWLWHDTWPRLAAYAEFHLRHEYYNMEFLGRTYYEPPMPRLYAWLMTAATVPLTGLLLAGLGGARALRESVARRWLPMSEAFDEGRAVKWLEHRPLLGRLTGKPLGRGATTDAARRCSLR
jgi:4-amino-4-deoxy-L-arabinose transferase-like glycosyltransferase